MQQRRICGFGSFTRFQSPMPTDLIPQFQLGRLIPNGIGSFSDEMWFLGARCAHRRHSGKGIRPLGIPVSAIHAAQIHALTCRQHKRKLLTLNGLSRLLTGSRCSSREGKDSKPLILLASPTGFDPVLSP
jgi:hypothetical protein